MEVTKEMFDQWMGGNQVTAEVFNQLRLERQDLLEQLGTGRTLNMASADETLAATAKLVGNVEGLDRMLNMFYDNEEEE